MMLFVSLPEKADAQFAIAEVIKAAIKKVVKAIDLKVQRLQNQTIWLQNAQKAIENQLSKLKLDEISGWSQKQKDLYEKYYKELQAVKSLIRYYQRIRDVTETQTTLVSQYNHAWGLLRQDQHFSSTELEHMQGVYSGILKESVKNLDEIMLLISSFKTQMSDEKRLELIDAAAKRMDTNCSDLKRFNTENFTLSLHRAKDENELLTLKNYYGIH
ncbi:conjugal transfer protein TraI [Mucilaginibacter gracilis]|nr:conjugal transfer protein TraI [Mucilaginibacter gracilis]